MKTSKGEAKIIDILNKEKIIFEREKTFKDLQHNGVFYRFDFYLPYVEGGPVIIEYEGEQHYKEAWGGRKELLHRQENDRKKNSFCLANQIPLYRIPYWELDKITTAHDLLQPNFKVISKYHNDIIYKDYIARNY